jgi:hypothetical protein
MEVKMQPNDKAGFPTTIWDEQNQVFVFNEISYQVTNELDTGSSGTETPVFDIKMNTKVQLSVLATNGDVSAAVLDIQHSPFETGPWFDSGVSTPGGSSISPIFPDSARYVKAVVNDPGQEGSTATVVLTAR